MALGSGHLLQLVSDNFILDGGRSGNRSPPTTATFQVNSRMRGGEVFSVANFNGKKLILDYSMRLMESLMPSSIKMLQILSGFKLLN